MSGHTSILAPINMDAGANAGNSLGPLYGTTSFFALNLVNFDWVTWHDYERENWVQVDALLNTAIGYLNIKGLWRPTTDYNAGDSVYDPRDPIKIFRCLLTHTSSTDFDVDEPLYWELLDQPSVAVTSVFNRIGSIVPLEGDYDEFFYTKAQSDATYLFKTGGTVTGVITVDADNFPVRLVADTGKAGALYWQNNAGVRLGDVRVNGNASFDFRLTDAGTLVAQISASNSGGKVLQTRDFADARYVRSTNLVNDINTALGSQLWQQPSMPRNIASATILAAQPNGTVGFLDGLPYLVDSSATGSLSCTNDLGVNGLLPAGAEPLSALYWGVDPSGVLDSGVGLRAARTYCIANDRSLLLPAGTYNDISGTTGVTVRPWPLEWYPGDADSGGVPYWTMTQRKEFHQFTLGASDPRLVGTHWSVNTDGPANVEPIKVSLNAGDGPGHTGVYINTSGYANCGWITSFHAESRCEGLTAHINYNSETRCYNATQAAIGFVVKMSSGSTVADNNPNLDINHPITGSPPVYNPNAIGVLFSGNDDTDADKGGWPVGIEIAAGALRSDCNFFDVYAPHSAAFIRNRALEASDAFIRNDPACNRFIDLRGTTNIGMRFLSAPGIAAVQMGGDNARALYWPNSLDAPIGVRNAGGEFQIENAGQVRFSVKNGTGATKVISSAVDALTVRGTVTGQLLRQQFTRINDIVCGGLYADTGTNEVSVVSQSPSVPSDTVSVDVSYLDGDVTLGGTLLTPTAPAPASVITRERGDARYNLNNGEFHDPTNASSWRIVGNTLECWGTAATVASVDTVVSFAKTFARAPIVSVQYVGTRADRFAASSVPTVTDVSLRVINTATNAIVAETVHWRVVGEWDGN